VAPSLPQFLERADRLERAVGPIDLVFGHNDLLAANFIDDGARLWLIDWDYAGWGTPLFDLGGLSSNNSFTSGENDRMLADYFETPASDELRRKLQAMLAASLLRESMWSMVSELKSAINFDYVSYTEENLRRFEAAFNAFEEMEKT
jgi:thiamine kinase-like enzyme